MNEREEEAYSRGSAMAWRLMLGECLRQLGLDGLNHERALALIADTRIALRTICAEYGDNDWPDHLHPQDVIDNHLRPYLENLASQPGDGERGNG